MLNKIQESNRKEEHEVKIAIMKEESEKKMRREDEMHKLQVEEMKIRIEIQKLKRQQLKNQLGITE